MVLESRKFEEWDKGLSKQEKIWIAIAIIAALLMSITTVIAWPSVNPNHEVPTVSMSIDEKNFENLALNFSSHYDGKTVPPGTPIYILARQYYWSIGKLVLIKGIEYDIWVSSMDVIHGFEIVGAGVVYNLMVMPGMAYLVHISFSKPGTYYLICNEYCGYGHPYMRAIIEVI